MGKDSPEYREATSTLELNADDMLQLGAQDGDQVQVVSLYGQTWARCRRGNLPIGLAFIAYGPASSDLLGAETGASGMPALKQCEVIVRVVEGGTHAG